MSTATILWFIATAIVGGGLGHFVGAIAIPIVVTGGFVLGWWRADVDARR